MPSNLVLIVSIVLYALVTYGLTEVFRKHRRIGAAFIILSFFTFPWWAQNRDSWFEWVKILSVLLPMVVVSFMRIAEFENKQGKIWSFIRKPWTLWFAFFILALNIFEASLRDWEFHNYSNALSGFVLIATIPLVGKYWRVEKECCGDLIVDFAAGWCFLYTTWNAAFLLGCIPDEFAGGLAILIACELYSLLKRPDLYIMGRIYTLSIFVVQLSVFDVFPWMDSSHWFNQSVVNVWGLLNLIFAVGYLFWYLWQIYQKRAGRSFRHPASAPEGVFTAEEKRKSLSGFSTNFYYHQKV